MPQPAIQTEADFYNSVSELTNSNKIELTHQQKGSQNQPQQHAHLHTLKSLQAIPEIILPSGKKIGPFEKGQVIEPPANEEDVKFLLNNSICQRA